MEDCWQGYIDRIVADVPRACYIGGEWVEASDGRRMVVDNPSTGLPVAEVADASIQEAGRALDAAEAGMREWATAAPRTRSEALRKAFELMTGRSEELARLVVVENGKTLTDARSEIAYAAEFFRWYAEEAVRNVGEVSVAPSGGNRIVVLQQPIGVAVLVTPWNFPAAMLTRKIGPALAAGCSVICKPAPETPLTALAIAQVLEEVGIPPGVVNVLPSRRAAEVVRFLLRDPRARKLSFTGSTEVGRKLLGVAAANVVSCSMELGGNAPFIVFADADMDEAVAGAVMAKMRNGGEACTAANRFYVQEAVREEFCHRLATAMGMLKVGDGLEEGVEVGPLVSAAALDKVDALVTGALAEGARAVVGGKRLMRGGWFYPPTVLTDVRCGSPILATEVFGPVATVVSFEREDEVVGLSNDTEHGLVAYLYTADLGRGFNVAERLEAGMVGINRGVVSDPAAPFGGVKQSGLGREGGHAGMLEYLETKYIACSW
jgi:succinate-semialdehyde dehydrogenase/glutarate-semialdehyde dehydrogenase